MNKKIIVLVIACLIIGFSLGIFVTRLATHKRIKHMIEMGNPPKFKDHLKEELNLSDEQSKTFELIFREHMNEVKEIRHADRQRMRSQMDSLFIKLGENLDEEQQEELRNFEANMRRNHQRRVKQRRPRE